MCYNSALEKTGKLRKLNSMAQTHGGQMLCVIWLPLLTATFPMLVEKN